MKKKKLLFVMPFFYKIGGVEKVIKNRLLFLQDYFEILVFESNADKNADKKENLSFNVYSINYKEKAIISIFNYIKIYKKLLNDFKPDEVIVVDNGWKSLLLPYFSNNLKVSYEVHNNFSFKNNKGFSYFFKKTSYYLLALRFFRLYFLTNRMSKTWFHNNKIVVPNGILLSNNFKERKINKILWVGRDHSQKGIDLMIKIWQSVCNKQIDWELCFYTPTPISNNLLNRLKNGFNMKNIISETDVNEIYNKGSIFVNTSRYEGFGMSILEAMHFSLPIVAFDCDFGPSDLIENNDNGYLIKPFDCEAYAEKLIQLMQNKNLRLEMGKKSYEKSLNFDLKKIHEKWLEIYNN